MKLSFNLVWLSLFAGAIVNAVSYDGYQVHRVKTGTKLASVKRSLASISHSTWDQSAGFLDVLIHRDQVDAFNALDLKSRTLHADLGHSITNEAHVKRSWKRQANETGEDPWFDSYHPYDDVSCLCHNQESWLMPSAISTLNGGMSYKSLSQETPTGLALEHRTRDVISSVCIFMVLMDLESQLFSGTEQFMHENGSQPRYVIATQRV